ncbi:hypothetical protein BJY01DRAFT_143241 [Aspergillus pseudoustus]|uniref:Uncharacterized protein n=1 Tax=Aspergillus pseudoustus TaxID=1810923 RepID=A0ABR4IG99_9EURO
MSTDRPPRRTIPKSRPQGIPAVSLSLSSLPSSSSPTPSRPIKRTISEDCTQLGLEHSRASKYLCLRKEAERRREVPRLDGLKKSSAAISLRFQVAAQVQQPRQLQANVQTMGAQPGMQGRPQPVMNPQQFQPGQQYAQFVMPQIRQITPQDIQVARERLGAQVQNLTDDQLRDALRQRQMHAAQARAAQALANQQNQYLNRGAGGILDFSFSRLENARRQLKSFRVAPQSHPVS